ncbi:hypothetical protein HG530_015682 [Fusarium avenaceum]|nr:hypothetical protein DER45DRAFT_541282 [Fusarium avenaceum]KAI6748402.1 hypothetical protein HG530_015682 [Fusarium avenaceum]
MIISDSPLFKEYARSVLSPEFRSARAFYSPFGVVDIVVQHLVDFAKLETTRFKICNAAADSFDLAVEGHVVGTGAFSSTIEATDASLSFNGFSFGKIKLPQIQTSFWGTNLAVQEQRVDITDSATWHAFIRSLIVDDNTSLQVESKECTVRALGTSSTCDLHLEMPLKATGGPRVLLKKLVRMSERVTAVFSLEYSGPVEIDYGHCAFEFRNGHNETLAELKGDLNLVQGQAVLTLHGTMRDGVTVSSNKIRLVGVGVPEREKSWLSATVREIDTVFNLEPRYVEQL